MITTNPEGKRIHEELQPEPASPNSPAGGRLTCQVAFSRGSYPWAIALLSPAWTLVLFLFGCAGEPSGSDQQTSEPRDPTSIGGSADGNEDASNPGNSARLLKTGFGQSGEYAWVTSLVENQSKGNIGQFVTVQFNLLDSEGEILASTDQVESFSRADQKLAVGTQVDIPDRGKVAKVEATMEVSDYTDVDVEPFPEITTGNVRVVESKYGGLVGRVQVSNPTDKSLKSPRVGVICLDPRIE